MLIKITGVVFQKQSLDNDATWVVLNQQHQQSSSYAHQKYLQRRQDRVGNVYL